MTEKTPTFADFNPTNDERVAEIKAKTDELITLVNEYADSLNGHGKRRAALAVTNYEQAAMWAVKSLFS
jgi:hypothetical protein